MHVWGQRVYENSVLSAQFCCEAKTVLTNKVYFFKKRAEAKKKHIPTNKSKKDVQNVYMENYKVLLRQVKENLYIIIDCILNVIKTSILPQ